MKTKMIIILLTSLTIGIATSCEKGTEDIFIRHFKIQQGEHYSTPRLVEVLQNNRLVFKARFDNSAMYNLENDALQTNKNKLLGFSDCNSLHHENSARFAWQWLNDRIEIYAYCYVNSQRVESFVGTVNRNESNLYEIRLTDEEYIFYLNGEESVKIQRGNVCKQGTYYLLWPYFGGSVAAPHNINIDIEITRN